MGHCKDCPLYDSMINTRQYIALVKRYGNTHPCHETMKAGCERKVCQGSVAALNLDEELWQAYQQSKAKYGEVCKFLADN